MTTPNTPGVTSWRVTGTTEATEIAPDGTPVRGLRVYYTTGTGQSGSVFVPKGQDTPDNIRSVIAQAAANLDGIMGLTSEG